MGVINEPRWSWWTSVSPSPNSWDVFAAFGELPHVTALKLKLLPRNLTWNLKMMVSKRNLLFQGLLFRFHVKFQGCNYPQKTAPGEDKSTNLCDSYLGSRKHVWAENTGVLETCCFSLAWRCCLMIFTTFYIFCVNLWKLAVWQLFFLDAGSITTPRRKTAEVLCPYIFWVQDAIMESEGLKQGIPYPKECTACNHSGGDCLMGWEEHSNLQFLFGSFVRLGWYETSGGVEEGWLFIWV